ncbi:MAG: hypothetical protein QG673_2139 [Pseudomonadota bacterium]|nr:hypothetical protein [Pseudomonadota bacterium]
MREVNDEVVIQLKANQEFLCHKTEQIIRRNDAIDIFQETEKNRNRIETRIVKVFKLNKRLLKHSDGWDKYLKACVPVHRVFETHDTTEKIWKTSEEISLYVSSMLTTAPMFATTIRKH